MSFFASLAAVGPLWQDDLACRPFSATWVRAWPCTQPWRANSPPVSAHQGRLRAAGVGRRRPLGAT